jgi:uridine phosphorylase
MSYPKFKNKHLMEALFEPSHYITYRNLPRNLPKKFIFVYQKSAKNYILRKYKPKKTVLKNVTYYWYKDICFVKFEGIGAPNAHVVFEELIAMGGRIFLNIGTAGGLRKWGTFLCSKALRDEGTSYHYLPHGHFTFPDKKLTIKLGKSMKKMGIDYSNGITWTLDAPYRETKKEIKYYAKKGIDTVEMETSALFAVAKFRKVKIASAFVISDLLVEKWDPKFHKKEIKKQLYRLIDAAVRCLHDN